MKSEIDRRLAATIAGYAPRYNSRTDEWFAWYPCTATIRRCLPPKSRITETANRVHRAMTVQRDPQLIGRIVEMRDAGMTRSQARFTLDMGDWKFRTILREHSLTNGWMRMPQEARAASAVRAHELNVKARAKNAWVVRMLAKLTKEERAMYRSLRRGRSAGRPTVGRALGAVLKARREAA